MEETNRYLREIRKWYDGLQGVQRSYIAFRIFSLLPNVSEGKQFAGPEDKAEQVFRKLLDNHIRDEEGAFAIEHREKQLGLSLCLISLIQFVLHTYESEDYLLDLHNRSSVLPERVRAQLHRDNPDTHDLLFAYFASRRQALQSWLSLTREGGILNGNRIMNLHANS